MDSNGILHLTVNEYGRISLWDSPVAARLGKDEGEVVIQLSLTKTQVASVLRATQLSRDNIRAQGRGPVHDKSLPKNGE